MRSGSPARARRGGVLEALAQRLRLGRHLQFLGRMEPVKAKEIARCAMVCIPRKPFQFLREVVPPIKLVEALAMGKPVIVPILPVFCDELGPEPAGWFFRSGDPVESSGQGASRSFGADRQAA